MSYQINWSTLCNVWQVQLTAAATQASNWLWLYPRHNTIIKQLAASEKRTKFKSVDEIVNFIDSKKRDPTKECYKFVLKKQLQKLQEKLIYLSIGEKKKDLLQIQRI
eukprot:307828_1